MPLDFSMAPQNSEPKNILQYSTPVDAATVSISSVNTSLVLQPAGALTALTVNFPSSGLTDGGRVEISCTQIVTAVTMGGGTVVGALTALAAGGFAKYVYRLANTTWYRIG
jgi:hypothetical protein